MAVLRTTPRLLTGQLMAVCGINARLGSADG
jgi:hypothetical protein